jgi:hypothetical protein
VRLDPAGRDHDTIKGEWPVDAKTAVHDEDSLAPAGRHEQVADPVNDGEEALAARR